MFEILKKQSSRLKVSCYSLHTELRNLITTILWKLYHLSIFWIITSISSTARRLFFLQNIKWLKTVWLTSLTYFLFSEFIFPLAFDNRCLCLPSNKVIINYKSRFVYRVHNIIQWQIPMGLVTLKKLEIIYVFHVGKRELMCRCEKTGRTVRPPISSRMKNCLLQ